MSRLTPEIVEALSQPFPAKKVQWRQNERREGKAQALAYIEARDVMQRLDEVVAGDWEFSWEIIDAETVKGRLTVCGVTREDVGMMGSGPMGKTLKTAVSDALKRVAVHFGIGRYLYYLPTQYVPLDGKHFARDPELPEWAIPWTPLCLKAFSSARTIVPRPQGPNGNGGFFPEGPARSDEDEEPVAEVEAPRPAPRMTRTAARTASISDNDVRPADGPAPIARNARGTPQLVRSAPQRPATRMEERADMAPWDSEWTPTPDAPPEPTGKRAAEALATAKRPEGEAYEALKRSWMGANRWFHGELRKLGITHDQGKAYLADELGMDIEHYWDTGLSPVDVINTFKEVASKAHENAA